MQTLIEFLDQQLRSCDRDKDCFSRGEFRAIWEQLFDRDFPESDIGYEKSEETFLCAVAPEGSGAELQFRPGGWVINVSEGLLKGGISAAILAGILAMAGFPALPALVLPATLPLLFDLERVRLTKKERTILASLTLREEVRSERHSAKSLYEMLPHDVRNQLSELDFADLLEKCRKAGVADVHDDETMSVRPADQPRLRITVQ